VTLYPGLDDAYYRLSNSTSFSTDWTPIPTTDVVEWDLYSHWGTNGEGRCWVYAEFSSTSDGSMADTAKDSILLDDMLVYISFASARVHRGKYVSIKWDAVEATSVFFRGSGIAKVRLEIAGKKPHRVYWYAQYGYIYEAWNTWRFKCTLPKGYYVIHGTAWDRAGNAYVNAVIPSPPVVGLNCQLLDPSRPLKAGA
jgi:hypothetical protein